MKTKLTKLRYDRTYLPVNIHNLLEFNQYMQALEASGEGYYWKDDNGEHAPTEFNPFEDDAEVKDDIPKYGDEVVIAVGQNPDPHSISMSFASQTQGVELFTKPMHQMTSEDLKNPEFNNKVHALDRTYLNVTAADDQLFEAYMAWVASSNHRFIEEAPDQVKFMKLLHGEKPEPYISKEVDSDDAEQMKEKIKNSPQFAQVGVISGLEGYRRLEFFNLGPAGTEVIAMAELTEITSMEQLAELTID